MDALQASVLPFAAAFFLYKGGCIYSLLWMDSQQSEAFTWEGNLVDLVACF